MFPKSTCVELLAQFQIWAPCNGRVRSFAACISPAKFEDKKKKVRTRKRRSGADPENVVDAEAEVRRMKNAGWKNRKIKVSARKEKSAVEALKRIEAATVPL